jgi:peptide deformylase
MNQFEGVTAGLGRPAVLVPHDAPVLHQKCREYDWNDDREKLREFITLLRSEMRFHRGMGISAPQIGVPLRIMVIRTDENMALINPVVLATSDDSVLMDEGCLSFRGLFIKKKRPSTVRLRYQDENGETRTTVFNGITARVFLHEYDHLEGKTYVEEPSLTTKQKFEKWRKAPWKFYKYAR